MPLKEDVQSFIIWAINLGYPIENMPNEDALKSIFKSRQSSLFFNLMDKVRPRQQVSEIRKNILINKMENVKDQIVPACKRNFLPREMQRYLKIKDLEKQKNEYEQKLKEAQDNCNSDILKTKNLQKIKMTNNCDDLKTKLSLLELKLDSLTDNCNKEVKTTEKIETIMPVKLTSINSNKTLAANSVIESLKELDQFYRIYLISSNPHKIQETKEELWLKLKKIFSNIPNYIIWKIITHLKEEQLENLKTLNGKSLEDRNKKLDNMTIFDTNLLKLKSSLILIISKYISVHKEIENINKKFTSSYKYFTDGVQSKINLHNTDDILKLSMEENDEIISDYVVQYTKRNYSKGQIDFLINEIDRVKKNINDNQRQLDDHQIIITSLKQIYNDIMMTVNRIQQEILQLTQIKDKIYYTKTLLQYMLKDIQLTCQQKTKLSTSGSSLGCGESFNISDNVFCSTKLDLDCTTNSNMTLRCDNTIVSINNFGGSGVLSPYSTELMIFMKIPISKLHIMPKECWSYLLPNPLIIESHDSISTLHFCPGSLLTVDGSLKYLKSKNNWYKKIKGISNEMQNNATAIEVKESDFKYKLKQQREEITEILDKIDVIGINTNRILQKAEKYYQFLLNNPLKNYIPRTKLFNNQTYFDYDAEYSMYYRMSTTGVSIQE